MWRETGPGGAPRAATGLLALAGALVVAAGVALGAAPRPGAAATLTPSEQDRGVFSAARATSDGSFDETVAPDEASGFASFAAATAADVATPSAAADTATDLIGNLFANKLGARARVHASTATSASDGRAFAPGDAFFEVVFQADASESYWLVGAVSAASGGAVADAHARVELVDVAAGVPVFLEQAGPGQATTFSEQGTLQAGVEYRLTAVALAHARADGAIASGSGDSLAEAAFFVPEPHPAWLLATGAAGLLGLARLRARARTRVAATAAGRSP